MGWEFGQRVNQSAAGGYRSAAPSLSSGEHNPNGNPFTCLLLSNDTAEVVLNHHNVLPWVPIEPNGGGEAWSETTRIRERPRASPARSS
jgi:hypothetical protein